MTKITAAITGIAAHLPEYILTNEELSTMVDTTDEWIMTRIGIKERHILKGEGLGTSDMGAEAVKKLLEKKVKIEAVEHNAYQAHTMHQLSKESLRLERIARSNHFEQNNAGFIKHDNSYLLSNGQKRLPNNSQSQ